MTNFMEKRKKKNKGSTYGARVRSESFLNLVVKGNSTIFDPTYPYPHLNVINLISFVFQLTLKSSFLCGKCNVCLFFSFLG